MENNTQIKLVIWDLDNTLWKGSLAEKEDPKPFEDRIELIKKYLGKKYPDKFITIDINKFVQNYSDFLDYTQHLSSEAAYNLYVSIMNVILREKIKLNIPPMIDQNLLNGRKICILGNNIFELVNAFNILKFGRCCPEIIVKSNSDTEKEIFEKKVNENILKYNKKILPILDIDNLEKDKYFTIISDKLNYKGIKETLLQKGFEVQKDFVFFDNNFSENVGNLYQLDRNKLQNKI